MAVSSEVARCSYTCLDSEEYSKRPFFFPFDQIILQDRYKIIEPKWKGSCAYISRAWLCQKIISRNILEPTAFQLHNRDILVLGDNNPEGEHIQHIQRLFRKAFDKFEKPRILTVEEIELQYQSTGVDALLSYFKIYENADHFLFLFTTYKDKLVEGPSGKSFKTKGHLCGFVKKGDACAWFDPNYGEVTFEKYHDFIAWFKAETGEGVLRSYALMCSRPPFTVRLVKGEGGKFKQLCQPDNFFKDKHYYEIELISTRGLALGGIEHFQKEYESDPIPFLVE